MVLIFTAFVEVGIFLQKGADSGSGLEMSWVGMERSLEMVTVDSIVTGTGRRVA